jgi:hypothetical protein
LRFLSHGEASSWGFGVDIWKAAKRCESPHLAVEHKSAALHFSHKNFIYSLKIRWRDGRAISIQQKSRSEYARVILLSANQWRLLYLRKSGQNQLRTARYGSILRQEAPS